MFKVLWRLGAARAAAGGGGLLVVRAVLERANVGDERVDLLGRQLTLACERDYFLNARM